MSHSVMHESPPDDSIHLPASAMPVGKCSAVTAPECAILMDVENTCVGSVAQGRHTIAPCQPTLLIALVVLTRSHESHLSGLRAFVSGSACQASPGTQQTQHA